MTYIKYFLVISVAVVVGATATLYYHFGAGKYIFLPLPVDGDGKLYKTDMYLKIKSININMSADEFTKHENTSPDDKYFEKWLLAIQNRDHPMDQVTTFDSTKLFWYSSFFFIYFDKC